MSMSFDWAAVAIYSSLGAVETLLALWWTL
jgi:hypothetical protein